MVTLTTEGEDELEIWIEPWGDRHVLRPNGALDIEVESENQNNVQLDFAPAERRLTIWFQDNVGAIRFFSGGTLLNEWSAGTLRSRGS